MLSWEEFLDFYRRNRFCPGDLSPPRGGKVLNESQLIRKYNKYLKSQEKSWLRNIRNYRSSIGKDDPEWERIKQIVPVDECLFINRLIEEGLVEDVDEIKRKAGPLVYQIDRAHVLPKGAYKSLKHDPENIIPLNRYSHSNLDNFRDPIHGEQITKSEVLTWWRFIIGDDRMDRLVEKSNKGV